jgi:hypothetical protein
MKEATFVSDTYVLYGKESLVGQLAPGLRLCLAAEVATGLLCDRCVPVAGLGSGTARKRVLKYWSLGL